MNWIKKGPVLAVLGASALLSLFLYFFFDPILKRALIAGGEAAAGAKVEIASVRSKWLKGTLDIRGLAVADREQPMKNLVELTRMAFQFDVSAALRGKGVVREAAFEGLRAGTERKTSGALRAAPPSALGAAVMKQIAPAKTTAIEVKENAAGEVDAAKLQGLKKLDEAKAKLAEIEQRWKGKADEAKAIEKEAKDIADSLKSVGGGGNILQKAQTAADAQKRLKALIARVETQRTEAQKDVAEAQALVKEADELRKKDLSGLLASAGLPTLDSQDLAKRLLGAQTAARLTNTLKWIRWAREKAAARKATAPPAPLRRSGVDIEFPRAHSYPQFLLEGAKITGTLDGVAGGAIDLKGVLDGVTSNPVLYGKPATLTIAGKSGAGPSVSLTGRLDQHKDPVGAAIDFTGSGFSLAGTSLGDGEIGGTLTSGAAKLKGHIASTGDEWKGEILVEAAGVVLEPKVALAGTAGELVSGALKSLTGFNVRVAISGKEDDLKLSFSSNIGEAVAAAMRKAVSGKLEAQKKALEAKLAAIYGDTFKNAQSSADGLGGKLLGPLDAQKGALNKQLQDALGKALGGQGLDKLFKR